MGQSQLQLISNDLTHAKLNLERIVTQNPNCAEAAILLGCIYANEVFQPNLKDDKGAERKRAAILLERGKQVHESYARKEDDLPILYLLSRLYETEDLDTSLKCASKICFSLC